MGQVWTLYQTSVESGFAMSAPYALRTLPWSSELIRKSVSDIAAWVVEFNHYQASL